MAVRPETFQWMDGDSDHLLFHGETGDTHVLSAMPALVLRVLSERPMSLAEIANYCERALPDDADALAVVEAVLRAFEEMELAQVNGMRYP